MNKLTFSIILITCFILHIIEKRINNDFETRKCEALKLKYFFLSIFSFRF